MNNKIRIETAVSKLKRLKSVKIEKMDYLEFSRIFVEFSEEK